MTACIADHAIRGLHGDDCEDAASCRGCLVALADDPSLWCRRHGHRLHLTLVELPDLVAHIREHVEPGAAPASSGAMHTKAAAAPAPLNVAAVSDADDLYAAAAELAELVMVGRSLSGPDWSGGDVRPAAKRRTDWGDVVYVDPRAVGVRPGVDPALAAGQVCAWLVPHEQWLLERQEAAGAIEALLRLSGGAARRWPVREAPRYLPAPCPACDRLTLVRYAPGAVGLPVTIACTDDDCGEVVKEALYDWNARRVAHERRAG